MVDQLKQHIKNLEKFNKDRLFWLRLSGLVTISILLIIVNWTFVDTGKIYWILVSIGLILSAAWWYSTMRLIREIINHRLVEIEILSSIIEDIQEIKQDVRKFDTAG